MVLAPTLLQAMPGGGLFGSVLQLLTIVGTLILLAVLVAFGAFAYRSLAGDGVEWPDDEREDDSGVSRGGDDDEWDYY